MDNSKLPLDLSVSALPPEVALLVNMLIEGRVTDLVVVASLTDGEIIDGIFSGINETKSNSMAMIGALECAKRDWMRMFVESRVAYTETDEEDM